MKNKVTIVHLSDLHLGGSDFVPLWGEQVVETVNAVNPEILIVTGDLTTEGHVDEYEQVNNYLRKFKPANRIIVPGNHDSRNEGYTIFEEIFRTRYPFFENEQLQLLGVDSSQPDIDDGHIGRNNYQLIANRLNDAHRIKVLVLHHHLIPIPGTGRERHIPTDAGDVLKLCTDLNIQIILSGHKHLPWVWRLGDCWLITGGTATSRRLKGRSYPSFNILDIAENGFSLTEVNVATGTQFSKLTA